MNIVDSFPKSEKGQSLIEVLVALAASVAVVSAIAITVITSLNNLEYTKNQNLATQFASEGSEFIRKLSKDNWSSFTVNYRSPSYCLDQDENLTVMIGQDCAQNLGCANNVCIFARRIDIDLINNSECGGHVKVSSIVKWSDSKCTSASNPLCHQVAITSCLADINSIKPL